MNTTTHSNPNRDTQAGNTAPEILLLRLAIAAARQDPNGTDVESIFGHELDDVLIRFGRRLDSQNYLESDPVSFSSGFNATESNSRVFALGRLGEGIANANNEVLVLCRDIVSDAEGKKSSTWRLRTGHEHSLRSSRSKVEQRRARPIRGRFAQFVAKNSLTLKFDESNIVNEDPKTFFVPGRFGSTKNGVVFMPTEKQSNGTELSIVQQLSMVLETHAGSLTGYLVKTNGAPLLLTPSISQRTSESGRPDAFDINTLSPDEQRYFEASTMAADTRKIYDEFTTQSTVVDDSELLDLRNRLIRAHIQQKIARDYPNGVTDGLEDLLVTALSRFYSSLDGNMAIREYEQLKSQKAATQRKASKKQKQTDKTDPSEATSSSEESRASNDPYELAYMYIAGDFRQGKANGRPFPHMSEASLAFMLTERLGLDIKLAQEKGEDFKDLTDDELRAKLQSLKKEAVSKTMPKVREIFARLIREGIVKPSTNAGNVNVNDVDASKDISAYLEIYQGEKAASSNPDTNQPIW